MLHLILARRAEPCSAFARLLSPLFSSRGVLTWKLVRIQFTGRRSSNMEAEHGSALPAYFSGAR